MADDDDWVAAASLIALAAEHGYSVSDRSLEQWRYRGLLPRGKQPAGRSAWLYPPITRSQLPRLCHWRGRTRSLDLILLALWVEGFQIDVDRARASVRQFVDAWERELTRQLDGADDVSSAIEALARKLAGKRGRGALPRIARMTAAESVRACAYALAFAFNAEDEIARRKDDAVLLERMLGFRSGRGGGLATVIPLDEDTLRVAGIRPPGELRAMLDSASDDEFEFVRRLLHILTVWTPMILPQLVEQFGAKAAPVLALARDLFTDLPVELYAFATTAMLASLHAKGHAADKLTRHLTNATPGAMNLELLSALPRPQRSSAFERLPAQDQRDTADELARRRSTATRHQSPRSA